MTTRRWLQGFLVAGALAFAAAGCDGSGGGDGSKPAEDSARIDDDTSACVPQCEDKLCGPDGCGAECGVCGDDADCVDGACVAPDPCVEACAVPECGWVDVCDCGACGASLVCLHGTCQAPMQCDQKGFEQIRAEARIEPNDQGGFSLYFQSLAGTQAPFDLVVVELDSASGAAAVPLTVDAAFVSMQQQGARAYILTSWEGGSLRGYAGGGYDKLLVPSRGELEITALSGTAGTRFTATLQAVQFNEATVDPASGAITVLPHGQTWCLDDMILDTEPVHQNPACTPAGTGMDLTNIIQDFSMLNCYGQWINLHDRCEQTEALWLVATAGW